MVRFTQICISFITISLLLAGQSSAGIDPKTCVGLLLFNEGKGDTAKDSSGNGNDGTLQGNPKWGKGPFGGAVEFNGSNFVSVNDSKSLQMSKQVTVMFWVSTDKKMADMWNDRQAVVGKHYKEYEVGIYMLGQLHTYTSDGAGNYDEGIMTSIAGNSPTKMRIGKRGSGIISPGRLMERTKSLTSMASTLGSMIKPIRIPNPVSIR